MGGVSFAPAAGFPRYTVSSDGVVYGISGTLKPWLSTNGYAVIGIWEGGRSVRRPVHRLVLQTFTEEDGDGLDAAHIDGNRLNNCLSNLRWATRAENLADRVGHGTMPQGSRHYRTVITETDIPEIRRRRAAGEPGAALAKEFGISQQSLCNIVKRRTWRHVA